MKLYREYGVNPFSGCWPVLLQFPTLIALYSVLRFPQHPIHIPDDSRLYADVTAQIPPVTSPSDCLSLSDVCQATTEPSPPGASSQQQQALLRFMPILFGVFGFFFPAGLVVYWTTSNLWQIGQQYFMLRTRPSAEELAARADGKKAKKGFMASLMDRASDERQRREGPTGKSSGETKPGPATRPTPPPKKPGSGGNGGRSRKKRPKR